MSEHTDNEEQKQESINRVYEARLDIENEFDPDYMDVLKVEHHVDHYDGRGEVDVWVDGVYGHIEDSRHVDNPGAPFGEISTRALHEFIDKRDLPLREKLTQVSIDMGKEVREHGEFDSEVVLLVTFVDTEVDVEE